MLNFGKLIESNKDTIFYMYDGNDLTITKREETLTLHYRNFEITVKDFNDLEDWQKLYSQFAFKQKEENIWPTKKL